MKKHKLLFLSVIFAVVLLLPLSAGADFGNFAGDSDFGSDWSSGNDWSSGTDWDSDWDSDNDWSSGTTNWPSSGNNVIIYDTDGSSDEGFDFSFLLIVAVVIIIAVLKAKKTHNKNGGVKIAPPVVKPNLTDISEYRQFDPNFDEADLRENISNMYVRMQNAWTDKNLEVVRPFFSDTMYQQFDRQINMLRKRNQTNYVDRIAVLSVTLLGFDRDNVNDNIVAQLNTRIVDYTVDDKTGEVISGSDRLEKFMTYEWTLSRPIGATTLEKTAGADTVNCPNCGAPISLNQSAKCPYCDSIISLSEHDWVISNIRGVSQRTGR